MTILEYWGEYWHHLQYVFRINISFMGTPEVGEKKYRERDERGGSTGGTQKPPGPITFTVTFYCIFMRFKTEIFTYNMLIDLTNS